MIVINTLANTLPINGITTGKGFRCPSKLVCPAGIISQFGE